MECNFLKLSTTKERMYLNIQPSSMYVSSFQTTDFTKPLTREVIKKESGPYGIYYTLKCGWCVHWDNHTKRWEIIARSTGALKGHFAKDEITQIDK